MTPCALVSSIHFRIFFLPSPGSIIIGIAPALKRAKQVEINFMLKGINSKMRVPFLSPYCFKPEAMLELSSSYSLNEMEVSVRESVIAV